MSKQEHEQREETSEEREETMRDLDVPADQGEQVTGGADTYLKLEGVEGEGG